MLSGEEVNGAHAGTRIGDETLTLDGGDTDHEMGGGSEKGGSDRLIRGNDNREGDDIEGGYSRAERPPTASGEETQDQLNTERDEHPSQGEMSCAQTTLRSGTKASASVGYLWRLPLFGLIGTLLIMRVRHRYMLRHKS